MEHQALTYEVHEHNRGGILRRYFSLRDINQIHTELVNHLIPPPNFQWVMLLKGTFQPGLIPPNWANLEFIQVPLTLTVQEAAMMAEKREFLGIKVKFADADGIHLLATGQPVALPRQNRLIRALKNGGYRTPTASSIYHMRKFLLSPNCILRNYPGQGLLASDILIIHIFNRRRVSKDVKELSYNSLVNIHPLYETFKDVINNIHQAALLPSPESLNIISASHLQLE